MPFPHRIPLTKFPSVRRLLSEAGSEIPDMNSITQAIKFKLGFAEEGEPTPEILKNYMDVSSTPPANHPPPHCSGLQHNVGQVAVTCGGTHPRGW